MILPVEYSRHPEESVLALMQNADSLRADRMVTPLQNWLVFEAEIARMLESSAAGGADSVITLGGGDERVLWEVWQRGCADELATRVNHMFLRPMPMPAYRNPWQEEALSARTDRALLTNYLTYRTTHDGNTNLTEWLLRSAVHLPAQLNPGFSDGLDPALQDVDALLRGSPGELPRVAEAVAKAVVEWFCVDQRST
jgi:hypothetical protein